MAMFVILHSVLFLLLYMVCLTDWILSFTLGLVSTLYGKDRAWSCVCFRLILFFYFFHNNFSNILGIFVSFVTVFMYLFSAIYNKIQGTVSEDEVEAYRERLQELEVKLRYCRHHLGDKAATDKLLAMRENEALGAKLDVRSSIFCIKFSYISFTLLFSSIFSIKFFYISFGLLFIKYYLKCFDLFISKVMFRSDFCFYFLSLLLAPCNPVLPIS